MRELLARSRRQARVRLSQYHGVGLVLVYLFPTIPVKNTENEYQTSKGGFRYATSVGGTLTGRGGEIVIIDDALSASEAMSKVSREKANDWFTGTLSSRLDDKSKGAIIVIMQRLHQEDLSGHLLEQGGWDHLNLPAIAPADMEIPISASKNSVWNADLQLDEVREPLPVLDRLRQILGTDFLGLHVGRTRSSRGKPAEA